MTATATAVLRVAQDAIDEGYREQGTNLTRYGAWYGMQGGEWCAMFVSWCLAKGGFSDDGGETTNVPGVRQTSARGWAYCPYMRDNFAAAGRRFSSPEVGDIFIVNTHRHTGLVAAVDGDGTFTSAEGNYFNRAANVRRTIGSCYYLRPPYSAASAKPGPGPRWWFFGVMEAA